MTQLVARITEWRDEMKTTWLIAILLLCLTSATGQGKVLTNEPRTGLPLIPATDSGKRIANLSYIYNEPTKMPDGQVCKSKMQANSIFFTTLKWTPPLRGIPTHRSGFKKVSGYESQRSQVPFYKPDGTIVIIVTGDSGEGENTDAYSVAYERYQPGISERTITSLTQGKIGCQ
jgi:hypothetical protein